MTPSLSTRFSIYWQYLISLMRTGIHPTDWWLIWRVRRHTMISPQRLRNVIKIIERIEREKIEGDLVECGVWKGGCVAVMAATLKRLKSKRRIWAFDSFEGLPEPTLKDGAKANDYAGHKTTGQLASIQKCVGTERDLRAILQKLRLDHRPVHIVKGWFQNTLPKTAKTIGPIAFLRLDGDWYESTKVCLTYLFDHVTPGGYVVIDDYWHWPGCKQAVDEFIVHYQLKVELVPIDQDGIFFQKPASKVR